MLPILFLPHKQELDGDSLHAACLFDGMCEVTGIGLRHQVRTIRYDLKAWRDDACLGDIIEL